MSKRILAYLGLGLAAYLVFLAASLPAARVYGYLAPQLVQQRVPLKFYRLQGTLWQGEAGTVTYKGGRLGSLSWDLSLLPLLRGRLALDWRLDTTGGTLGGYLEAERGGVVSLEAVEGRVPLADLGPLLPPVPVAGKGQLSLNLQSVSLVQGRPASARGSIVWHQAGLIAPQALDFGDLRLNLSPADGGGIRGQVSDAGGPLQAELELAVEENGRYRLKGQVGSREAQSTPLSQALGLLGRPDRQGRYRLNFNGRL